MVTQELQCPESPEIRGLPDRVKPIQDLFGQVALIEILFSFSPDAPNQSKAPIFRPQARLSLSQHFWLVEYSSLDSLHLEIW